uniref:Uncharacterized protein n=1 Tax=Romanomermis culicivorax TaxID=13658 RepID=A0A915IRU7_ROMCU
MTIQVDGKMLHLASRITTMSKNDSLNITNDIDQKLTNGALPKAASKSPFQESARNTKFVKSNLLV